MNIYKKPTFWVAVLGVVAAAFVIVCSVPYWSEYTPAMKWAKNLRVEDVQSIELVVSPAPDDRSYRKFTPEEFPEIVKLINQSNPRKTSPWRTPAGSEQTFLVIMTDGVRHTVKNAAGMGLVIDGEHYLADGLGKWDFTGSEKQPDDFQLNP